MGKGRFRLAEAERNWYYLTMLENPETLIARVRRLAVERTALWERASKLASEVNMVPPWWNAEDSAASTAGTETKAAAVPERGTAGPARR